MLAVVGPAVGTILIASIKSPDLTTGWVLIASPICGLVAGIILSRVMVKTPAARIVAAIVLVGFVRRQQSPTPPLSSVEPP